MKADPTRATRCTKHLRCMDVMTSFCSTACYVIGRFRSWNEFVDQRPINDGKKKDKCLKFELPAHIFPDQKADLNGNP